ncbi:MAG: SDR family NAD(P)-dependent oxidoreductase [Chitinophaga sp.]|uniref:SDR family NAD(P)-dependent oxidoreductase n=1 Tax=Chitinophaga sp. TaxID=1869181 RepID=UPI0025C72EB7|nr:SDR family NAD(P)-dependent oxidoreductase [Chitinophaga sp.]MBV8251349.1 SDR family NAD(P)-dependent oxidoreductase [Chitinophaga sp.]
MTEKIVLITGATRGLGLEAAMQLLQQGATVILTGRDISKGNEITAKLQQNYPQADFMPLVMSEPAGMGTIYEQVKAKYGRLDVLINNAAVTSTRSSTETGERATNTILSMDIADVKSIFETNVWGLLQLTRTLLPLLQESPAGRIINMSSELGSMHYQSDLTSPVYHVKRFGYNSSKTMVNLITIYLRELLVNTAISVFAVSPGWVKTGMGTAAACLEVPEGANIMVRAALEDVPENGFFTHDWQAIPW